MRERKREREQKDDLDLPTFVNIGEPTNEDKTVTADMLPALADCPVQCFLL